MPKISYIVNTVTAEVIAISGSVTLLDNEVVVTSEAEMIKLPMPVVIKLRNNVYPERPIKKFADRKTANHTVWPALEVLAGPPRSRPSVQAPDPASEPVAAEPQGDSPVATTTTKGKRAAKGTTKTKTVGKKGNGEARTVRGTFAGHILSLTGKDTTRTKGSLGHASFALVRDGMTYEQFIAKGGRPKDLHWDIASGTVKTKKG